MTDESIKEIAKGCMDDSKESYNWEIYDDNELVAFGRKMFNLGVLVSAEVADDWSMQYVEVDHAPLSCGELIRHKLEGK